jgi:hypothetical protein
MFFYNQNTAGSFGTFYKCWCASCFIEI